VYTDLSVLLTLNFHIHGIKVRSERREAYSKVLAVVLERMDLATLRVGFRRKTVSSTTLWSIWPHERGWACGASRGPFTISKKWAYEDVRQGVLGFPGTLPLPGAVDMDLFDAQGQRLYLSESERADFLEAARNADRSVRTFCLVLAYTDQIVR